MTISFLGNYRSAAYGQMNPRPTPRQYIGIDIVLCLLQKSEFMDVEDLFAKPKEGFANKSVLETIAALQRHVNHNAVLVEGIHRLVTLTDDGCGPLND